MQWHACIIAFAYKYMGWILKSSVLLLLHCWSECLWNYVSLVYFFPACTNHKANRYVFTLDRHILKYQVDFLNHSAICSKISLMAQTLMYRQLVELWRNKLYNFIDKKVLKEEGFKSILQGPYVRKRKKNNFNMFLPNCVAILYS